MLIFSKGYFFSQFNWTCLPFLTYLLNDKNDFGLLNLRPIFSAIWNGNHSHGMFIDIQRYTTL